MVFWGLSYSYSYRLVGGLNTRRKQLASAADSTSGFPWKEWETTRIAAERQWDCDRGVETRDTQAEPGAFVAEGFQRVEGWVCSLTYWHRFYQWLKEKRSVSGKVVPFHFPLSGGMIAKYPISHWWAEKNVLLLLERYKKSNIIWETSVVLECKLLIYNNVYLLPSKTIFQENKD